MARIRRTTKTVTMELLDLTLPTAAENLALDQALLDEAEAGETEIETLRIWEAATPAVVVGRSSRVAVEVNLPACRARSVPVVRRVSGGASIVAGPGCLMYAVVLSTRSRPALRMIDQAHQLVLNTHVRGLSRLAENVSTKGISDLVVGTRKFSGNSLRCQRHHVLYHGTLLYEFPLARMAELLRSPPRQPEYRNRRPHGEFVTNFPAGRAAIVAALRTAWEADQARSTWPTERVATLVADRYALASWNMRL